MLWGIKGTVCDLHEPYKHSPTMLYLSIYCNGYKQHQNGFIIISMEFTPVQAIPLCIHIVWITELMNICSIWITELTFREQNTVQLLTIQGDQCLYIK